MGHAEYLDQDQCSLVIVVMAPFTIMTMDLSESRLTMSTNHLVSSPLFSVTIITSFPIPLFIPTTTPLPSGQHTHRIRAQK